MRRLGIDGVCAWICDNLRFELQLFVGLSHHDARHRTRHRLLVRSRPQGLSGDGEIVEAWLGAGRALSGGIKRADSDGGRRGDLRYGRCGTAVEGTRSLAGAFNVQLSDAGELPENSAAVGRRDHSIRERPAVHQHVAGHCPLGGEESATLG